AMRDEFGAKMHKICPTRYWRRRYDIFHKYDAGVCLTNDMFFSVTFEGLGLCVANHIVDSLKASNIPPPYTVVDVFAGAGGNTIALARHPLIKRVISIELNPSVAECNRRNCMIYGVKDKVEIVLDDAFSYLAARGKERVELEEELERERQEASEDCGDEPEDCGMCDAMILSPPWGGPSYMDYDKFPVDLLMENRMAELSELAGRVCPRLCMLLPKNSCEHALERLVQKTRDGARDQGLGSAYALLELDDRERMLALYTGSLASSIGFL
ncbi:RNA cap guanine-N2 methyltransferase, partial [Kipferlia bialata]